MLMVNWYVADHATSSFYLLAVVFTTNLQPNPNALNKTQPPANPAGC